MSKLTKEEALAKIEELKKYISEEESKPSGIKILNKAGNVIFTSTKLTIKEAIKDANLSEADLSEADLSEADLSGADLSGADLRGVDLSKADLSGADLSKADLRWANLSEANLSEADLSEADLSEADLRGVDLRWAELNCAKFFGKTSNPKILKKDQVSVFLEALGFKIED